MTTPFDRALENRALTSDAEEFAARHGRPGTSDYRAAWVRFRQTARQSHDERGRRPAAPDRAERPRSGDLTPNDLIREVLDAAIRRAMEIDGARMANAQLLEPRTQALRLVAHHGFFEEFLGFFKIVDDSTTACGSALDRGTPVLISDITDSPVFARTIGLGVMLRAGCRAVASLPIRSPNGRVIAVLSTHHPQATTWTDDRMLALHDLCESTGHLLNHLLEKRPPQRP